MVIHMQRGNVVVYKGRSTIREEQIMNYGSIYLLW